MSVIMRPLLNYSVPHMMQADFTPRLTDWLAARTERVLASVVKYDASVHTVTCKLFHYSSSVKVFFF